MMNLNIPKTPQQVFLKKDEDVNKANAVDAVNATEAQHHSIKKVKHIDKLYSKTFLDDYFT
jgi:hypothetical protein